MNFWLGVLAVIGSAGEGRVPEPCLIRVGMGCAEVEGVLGPPLCDRTFVLFPGPIRCCCYERNDWLGGRQEWNVTFNADGQIKEYKWDFRPFGRTPPWLDAIRAASAPSRP